MSTERPITKRLHMTVEPGDDGDLLVTVSGLRVRVHEPHAVGRLSEGVRSEDPIKMLEAAALGASEVIEAANRARRLAEDREIRVGQALDAIGALITDASAGRALTPTELDVQRILNGDLAGPELEQLLRRGR